MRAAMNLVRLLIALQVAVLAAPGVAALSMDYYGMSCPFAEMIVRNIVSEALMKDPTLAAGLLRLHFHDCFVQGCDASVLLNSTPGNTAEKDALPNQSLRGYEVIDRIKETLEQECPGTVSCADILALAARDAVFMAGGPYYGVPQGRRDGIRSVDVDAYLNLPSPTQNASGLIRQFLSLGLNVQDTVALSGGHTLGVAHCASFRSRLQAGDAATTLDASLASALGATCGAGDKATAAFDRTSTAFDGVYFRDLQARRGLLISDQTLFESPETKAFVNMFAMNQAYFFYAFQQGMHKMGQIGVKEGDLGQIRKTCSRVNN